MRWVLPVLIVLLTCCAPVPAARPLPSGTPIDPSAAGANFLPTPDWSSYRPSVDAFHMGADCPHLCWLGINPGVTSASDAFHLLQASDQIDQKTLKQTGTGIVATWFTERTGKLSSAVYLYLQKDVVKSVSFDGFAPFKMRDMTGLLGNPDGVRIDMEVTDDVMDLSYQFYYAPMLVLIGSDASASGPNPDDGLLSFSMGIGYDATIFHPWLGYGHLREYLAKKAAP